MSETRIGLDNPAFAGRLRTTTNRRSTYERRVVVPTRRVISDFRVTVPDKPKQAKTAQVVVRRAQPKSVPSRQKRSQVLRRQLVGMQKGKIGRRRALNLKGVALTSLAVILFVFGLGVGIMQLNTNQKVKAQVKTLSAADDSAATSDDASNGLPAETPPDGNVGEYRVAPKSPRVIAIPSLGVEARVLRLGVKANNELKAPTNIFDAGWYEGSALPGESGAVLINGHVHGPTKPGVFVGLKKMRSGDKITIERGDGKLLTYRVVKSQSYNKDNVDMGAAFSSAEPGKPGLNLITCDGDYDSAGNYSKRLIVFAVQE